MAIVTGGPGDDFLTTGTGGNDEYYGLGGDDILADYGGGDLFDGGEGDDTLLLDQYGELTGNFLTSTIFEVEVDLRERFQSDGGIAGDADQLISIENYTHLGDFNMTVKGDSDTNILTTDAGTDRLEGRGGDDILSAGAGDDQLSGDDGFDILTGGQGADQFEFKLIKDGSLDTITDFDPLEGDTLAFSSHLAGISRFLNIEDTDDGALISFGPAEKGQIDIVLLEGVYANEISADDFTFIL